MAIYARSIKYAKTNILLVLGISCFLLCRHSTDYNGSPVYKREGRETLYIYFFTRSEQFNVDTIDLKSKYENITFQLSKDYCELFKWP